jgi:ERCC4-type nuclease
MRKTIAAENIVAICDSREQLPLDLSPIKTVRGTLATGDYSLVGGEHLISIERKSLPDFLSCVGRERERFEREIQRMLGYECRAIVIESTWAEIEAGLWVINPNHYKWKSKVNPNAALGSALGWIAQGIPVIMTGDHERAGKFVSRLLFTAARRRWNELRSFGDAILKEAESA